LGSISGCDKKQRTVKYAGVYSDSSKAGLVVMGGKPSEAMTKTHQLLLGLKNGLEFIIWVTDTPEAYLQRDTVEPRIEYKFAPTPDSALALAAKQFMAWSNAREKMLLLNESLPDSVMKLWRKSLGQNNIDVYTIR